MLKENEYLGITISCEKALYLATKAISEGKEKINLNAFEERNKESLQHPDFKGSGLAIWINTKKDSVPKNSVEDI